MRGGVESFERSVKDNFILLLGKDQVGSLILDTEYEKPGKIYFFSMSSSAYLFFIIAKGG